jgi:hypothetical protein
MPRNDNYPDDIRSYDDDPRSPFYVDPNGWMEEASDVLAEDMAKQLADTGLIDLMPNVEYSKEEIELEAKDRDTDVENLLPHLAYEHIEQYPDYYNPNLEWD